MKTKLMKQIPFDLERALRIQNGEEEGKVVNKNGYNVRIICTDAKGDFPVIGLVSGPDSSYETPYCFTETGKFTKDDPENIYDLLLKIPIKQKQFDLKPFDKVLVRDYETEQWQVNIFSHYNKADRGEQIAVCLYSAWVECIPYNDDTKYLVGTTDSLETLIINV